VAVIGAGHPQDAGAAVERLTDQVIPLAPERERPGRHLDVPACGPVDGSDDACVAAGARAAVSRTPRIDQRDVRAGASQVQRRPSAECAGAYDRDTKWHYERFAARSALFSRPAEESQ